MRIKEVRCRNFASYKELACDFTDKKLTLVAGPTGSGKSTLCDVAPWVLFGKTAKGGAVDEVRSWNAEGPTEGTAFVEIAPGQVLQIKRSRSPNDLTFLKPYAFQEERGKDLTDTQKLINELLGVDYETYLAGAYFHEFSQTAAFFTIPAKLRRQIIEELADLSLAIKLVNTFTEYRKELKGEQSNAEQSLAKVTSNIEVLNRQLKQASTREETWFTETADLIKRLQKESTNFEEVRAKQWADLSHRQIRDLALLTGDIASAEADLQELRESLSKYEGVDEKLSSMKDTRCEHCGGKLHSDKIMSLTKQANLRDATLSKIDVLTAGLTTLQNTKVNSQERYEEKVKAIKESVFTQQDRLDALLVAENPHTEASASIKRDLTIAERFEKTLKQDLTAVRVELSDVELLLALVDELRTACIKSAVTDLQTRTNEYLARFFDAEIKIAFSAEGADKIDVDIFKDGNQCSYTQLSKGQRQMLKLCFGVSVMQSVNNRNGGFNALFFDEALDGLSEELKVKAYKLFEQLSAHFESVYIVEHSEALKVLFNNRIDIRLVDGNSEIAD